MEIELRKIVLEASKRPDVREAVDRVYREVQQQIDARRPVCVVSGRCCRFEEYGHRLYVTTLELARFVNDLEVKPDADWNGAGCPFQRVKLCTVHSIRPFGCRVYFCDATSTDWQHGAYERFHADLKRLHEQLGVPYTYIEWREALDLLGVATSSSSSA